VSTKIEIKITQTGHQVEIHTQAFEDKATPDEAWVEYHLKRAIANAVWEMKLRSRHPVAGSLESAQEPIVKQP
jgi:hypothetical protein